MTAFWAGLAAGALAAGALVQWLHVRSRRRLGRFFSFAAHEINTPITAINMTVLNFSSGVFGPVAPEQAPWLELLREQVIRLGAMVGELRDLVHLVIGKDLHVTIEEVSARDAVKRAVEAVEKGLAQSSSGVDLALPQDLPAVRVDEERFSRTLVSLLHHARKFKTRGGRLSVAARTAEGGRAVEIEVAYPCLPLTTEEAARSLALLYPADAEKGAARATGLGLGVLRELMRRQGGDVRLRLDGGGRAVLRLTAPAAKS